MKRKRKSACPSPLLDDSPKRSKVQAQRKFAQGSNVNSPVITPIRELELEADVPKTLPEPVELLPMKRPNTEDFLTFLCFRGTPILPPNLNFFNTASIVDTNGQVHEIKSGSPKNGPIDIAKCGNSSEKPFIAFGVRKRADPIVISKQMDRKRRHALALQALRRKYQEQKMAKIRALAISKLSEKVTNKTLVKTNTILKTETVTKKNTTLQKTKVVATKHVKVTTQTLKTTLRRPKVNKKMCLRSFRGRFIQKELPFRKKIVCEKKIIAKPLRKKINFSKNERKNSDNVKNEVAEIQQPVNSDKAVKSSILSVRTVKKPVTESSDTSSRITRSTVTTSNKLNERRKPKRILMPNPKTLIKPRLLRSTTMKKTVLSHRKNRSLKSKQKLRADQREKGHPLSKSEQDEKEQAKSPENKTHSKTDSKPDSKSGASNRPEIKKDFKKVTDIKKETNTFFEKEKKQVNKSVDIRKEFSKHTDIKKNVSKIVEVKKSSRVSNIVERRNLRFNKPGMTSAATRMGTRSEVSVKKVAKDSNNSNNESGGITENKSKKIFKTPPLTPSMLTRVRPDPIKKLSRVTTANKKVQQADNLPDGGEEQKRQSRKFKEEDYDETEQKKNVNADNKRDGLKKDCITVKSEAVEKDKVPEAISESKKKKVVSENEEIKKKELFKHEKFSVKSEAVEKDKVPEAISESKKKKVVLENEEIKRKEILGNKKFAFRKGAVEKSKVSEATSEGKRKKAVLENEEVKKKETFQHEKIAVRNETVEKGKVTEAITEGKKNKVVPEDEIAKKKEIFRHEKFAGKNDAVEKDKVPEAISEGKKKKVAPEYEEIKNKEMFKHERKVILENEEIKEELAVRNETVEKGKVTEAITEGKKNKVVSEDEIKKKKEILRHEKLAVKNEAVEKDKVPEAISEGKKKKVVPENDEIKNKEMFKHEKKVILENEEVKKKQTFKIEKVAVRNETVEKGKVTEAITEGKKKKVLPEDDIKKKKQIFRHEKCTVKNEAVEKDKVPEALSEGKKKKVVPENEEMRKKETFREKHTLRHNEESLVQAEASKKKQGVIKKEQHSKKKETVSKTDEEVKSNLEEVSKEERYSKKRETLLKKTDEIPLSKLKCELKKKEAYDVDEVIPKKGARVSEKNEVKRKNELIKKAGDVEKEVLPQKKKVSSKQSEDMHKEGELPKKEVPKKKGDILKETEEIKKEETHMKKSEVSKKKDRLLNQGPKILLEVEEATKIEEEICKRKEEAFRKKEKVSEKHVTLNQPAEIAKNDRGCKEQEAHKAEEESMEEGFKKGKVYEKKEDISKNKDESFEKDEAINKQDEAFKNEEVPKIKEEAPKKSEDISKKKEDKIKHEDAIMKKDEAMKKKSLVTNESDLSPKTIRRPTRKSKEAAAIYMELLSHKLVNDSIIDDDDNVSIDSFPELPNVKKTEQRENELKAQAKCMKDDGKTKLKVKDSSETTITSESNKIEKQISFPEKVEPNEGDDVPCGDVALEDMPLIINPGDTEINISPNSKNQDRNEGEGKAVTKGTTQLKKKKNTAKEKLDLNSENNVEIPVLSSKVNQGNADTSKDADMQVNINPSNLVSKRKTRNTISHASRTDTSSDSDQSFHVDIKIPRMRKLTRSKSSAKSLKTICSDKNPVQHKMIVASKKSCNDSSDSDESTSDINLQTLMNREKNKKFSKTKSMKKSEKSFSDSDEEPLSKLTSKSLETSVSKCKLRTDNVKETILPAKTKIAAATTSEPLEKSTEGKELAKPKRECAKRPQNYLPMFSSSDDEDIFHGFDEKEENKKAKSNPACSHPSPLLDFFTKDIGRRFGKEKVNMSNEQIEKWLKESALAGNSIKRENDEMLKFGERIPTETTFEASEPIDTEKLKSSLLTEVKCDVSDVAVKNTSTPTKPECTDLKQIDVVKPQIADRKLIFRKNKNEPTPNINAFSPENESSVYAFGEESEDLISTPFRRPSRRPSSTATSRSEDESSKHDDILKIGQFRKPPMKPDPRMSTKDDCELTDPDESSRQFYIPQNPKPGASKQHFSLNRKSIENRNIPKVISDAEDFKYKVPSSPSASSSSSAKLYKRHTYKQKVKSSELTPVYMSDFPKRNDTPVLVEAPVFHPTDQEFQDPLEYIERIRHKAEQFGICRIVPPSSFKPECKVTDDMRFTAYNQYVHKMLHRWGANFKELMAIKKYLETQNISITHLPWIGGMEIDLPRLYQTVQNLGGLKEVIEKKKWPRVSELMKIPKSAQDRVTKLDDIYCKYLLPYDTLSPAEREKLFDEVETEWAKRESRGLLKAQQKLSTVNIPDEGDSDPEDNDIEECITKGRNMALNAFYRIARNTMSMYFKTSEPLAQEVEQEYWNYVMTRQNHICVHSGSIDSGNWGYGFAVSKNSPFARHPWNLKVLTNNSGSLLRSLGPAMGVTVPTLHVGMVFSACCWYRDPHGLPWIEYLHTGASKIWYGIPNSMSDLFRSTLKKLVPNYCRNKELWLPSDTAMVPPVLLVENNVSLCRTVQDPGQFVIVFPKVFTSSISTGYVVSESVYFAPTYWLKTARSLFNTLRDSSEPSMFSLDRLLISIANDTRCSIEVSRQVIPYIQELCNREKEGREKLKAYGQMETEKLQIPEVSKNKKKKLQQGDEGDYECEICRMSLYISVVFDTQEGVTYCLDHAIEVIENKKAQINKCKLIITYDDEELAGLPDKIKATVESKLLKKCSK